MNELQDSLKSLDAAESLAAGEAAELQATLASMRSLPIKHASEGRTEDVLPVLEQIVHVRMERQGRDDPDTFSAMAHLAVAYNAAMQFDKAVSVHEQLVERKRAVLGERHLSTLRSMSELAVAYSSARRFEDALPLLEQALAGRKETLGGADDSETLLAMSVLAEAYLRRNPRDRFQTADEMREALRGALV